MPPILLFLVQALIVITIPFAIWSLPAVRRAVPLVVLQILVGIVLGPTVLGRIAPDLAELVLPGPSLSRLSGLSWLAVLFFVFLIGLRLDTGEFARKGRYFFAVGLSSVLTPFFCGVGLGALVVGSSPQLMGPNATETQFVLAIGLCVSVTALPVLGAILQETGLIRHELGRLALGLAALNDVVLWIVMTALLATLDTSSNGVIAFLAMTLSSALYFGFMIFIVRPLLAKLFDWAHAGKPGLSEGHFLLVVAILLASALITEALGLHHLIGAFVAGVVMPKSVSEWIRGQFERITVVVLLPFFFISTGLNVDLHLESGAELTLFAASTLVAMGGKILGTAVPARLLGRSWLDALHLGTLMQCKGLMEVIILTILLDAGLVSNAAFSALILMALLTTALTMPLARAVAALSGIRANETEPAN